MTKSKTPTAEPVNAPAATTPPQTEGSEKTVASAPAAVTPSEGPVEPVEMEPISSRQEDFEIVYADWAGTTPDQIAGLRLMNGSYENPKVAHCWHFYQLGSGGLEIERE